MQVKDLITFYINDSSKTIDVTFRLETDGDDEIRNDSILIEEVKSYGYEFLNETNLEMYDDEDLFEETFNDNYFEDQIDETEIISFLNEYYMINPNKLPPSELF